MTADTALQPRVQAPPGPPAQRLSSVGRRNAELRLLVFAVVISVGAECAVRLAVQDRVGIDVAQHAAVLGALAVLAHLAVRRLAPAADPVLLPVAVLINGLGLAMIGRIDLATGEQAARLGKVSKAYEPLQQLWMGVGIVIFVLTLLVVRDHRLLARYSYTLALLGLLIMLVPMVLPARFSTVNGAKTWIRFAGFSLQPSEIAKLALLIFFAAYLVAKRDVLSVVNRSLLGIPLPRARDLGPVLVAWLASLSVLVFQKDLGTSVLFFGIFLVLLYVATERVSWVAIGMVLFAVGVAFAYRSFGHVRTRFDIWLHPFDDAADRGYQLVQGLFGFANGGILGTGLGRGSPQIVPFARTDFIIASIGEELGLVGVMAIIVLYGLLVFRGMRAALTVRDSFGKMLACGLAVALALQVFVVIGGVTRLIPLTGLTLPFLSYGGSSLVANYALVALLLRISDAARRPVDVPVAPSRLAPRPVSGDSPTTTIPVGALRRLRGRAGAPT